MLTLNKKRFFAIFPLLALLGALLITTLSPLSANADVKDTPYLNAVYNDKLYKDLSAHQHYWWLYSCFKNIDIDKVTESEVDNWDFFEGDGFLSGLGAMYTASPDNGAYRKCNDANMVKTAFNYLGFTNSRETFCSLPGAQYKEGGDATADFDECMAGAGDGNWDNNDNSGTEIMAWYTSTVESKKPTLTNPARYMRALASLVNGCDIQFSDDTLYKTADDVPGANSEADGSKYAVPVIVKVSGDFAVRYVLGIGIAGNRPVMVAAASDKTSSTWGPTQESTCNQLVNAAGDTAKNYLDFINRSGATDASGTDIGSTDDGSGSDEGTSCAVDGIGWLVCPVVTFLSKLNDAAFGFLNNFLNVPPQVFNDPATKNAWEAFRNIANIAFVIAFLVIIYSQMTGAGVSNYGIKKLLPKLIITAILVNVSFYICAIMVDLSNILGGALYDLIKGMNIGADTGAGGTGSTLWSNAGAIILGVGAAVGLLALIIFAPISLLAFALVILILIARQAFVVLLIVIAPLAFVAYLLPNTEQWFKKWWKALVAILMVFPIIALVFGASSLASDILIRVSEDGAGGGDDNQLMKIIGAAVLAIPLFAVPALLKGAMSAAGTVGAKLSGLQDKTNRFSGRRIKEGRLGEAKSAWDRNRLSARANRRAGIGNGMRARANRAFDRTRLGRAIGGERGQASAIHAVDKEWDESVKMHQGLYSHSSASDEQLFADMSNSELSEEKRAAAAGALMTRSRAAQNEAVRRAVALAKSGDSAAGSIQKQMASDMGSRKPLGVGSAALAELKRGKLGTDEAEAPGADQSYDFDSQIAQRAVSKLPSTAIPDIDPDDLTEISRAVSSGRISGDGLASLQSNIRAAYADERINRRIDDSARQQLDGIINLGRSENNNQTHEEALVENELYDMERHNPSNRDNQP